MDFLKDCNRQKVRWEGKREQGVFSKAKIKELLSRLLKLNNTPQEIALGVSIGVIIAVMPLYGFHTILCVIFAVLIPPANKIAILIGTNVSLPPTLPFITWGGYNIGRLILGNQYPPLNLSFFKAITIKNMLNFYYPLFIGSFVLGLFLATIFYFLTFWIVKNKMRAKPILLMVFTIVLSFSLPDVCVLADGYKGERIVYGVMPLGRCEYNNLGEVNIAGQKLPSVTFRTRAMGLNDMEKVYIDKKTHLPLKVERDVSLWFGHESLVERYDQGNFILTIDKFKNKKMVKRFVFKMDVPIQNAILLPFYLRQIDNPEIGWEIKVRLPDEFLIRLKSIEEVSVPAGKFMAYHFTSAPSKFEIWISKDDLRLPIKIKGLGFLGYTLVMKEHHLPQTRTNEVQEHVPDRNQKI